jgi:hypothetical protein
MNRSRPRTKLTKAGINIMYAVVHEDGAIMQSLFPTTGRAQSAARYDGDSVVPVIIDLGKEPVFIRRKVLRG